VEWTGFGVELGTCTVEEDGTVTVTAGTYSHGQGHETSYAQLVVSTLGVPLRDVKVIQSDTAKVARGMGTMGSRSLQVGGTAVQRATDEVLEKAKRLAAQLLEADAADIQVVHGQGHETAYAQLVTGTLGIPLSDVKVIQSDTKLVKSGMGTAGSRSLQIGGTAVQQATDEVLEKAKRLAAQLLEADAGDIEVVPGQGLGVAGSPASAIPWAQLAAAAKDPSRAPEGFEGGLTGENDFETPDATYPFGSHLAVVEVDMETGSARLIRHVTVDDAGTMMNPLMVEGQVHGGIAQGVAQAMYEEIAFDEDGNNVTGSLASYAMPSASDLPLYETERTQTPSPRNPLGAKGIGEAGAIGATPAVWNAVIDAVAHLGVKNIDMPTTPQRVWEAINSR
jgi:carbon-monoxide dehydrogenase large subunit